MCKPRFIVMVLVGTALMSAPTAQARIKLITLPVRERVEVQLDHPSVTLIEEERIVPLVKGLNQIDFSWANTRIDPNTIVFRVVNGEGPNPAQVKVLSVSYPPNENALVWQVAAESSGSAKVRISYLLGQLDKSFNYRAVADHDEKTLTLSQYIRLKNFSNEEFGSSNIFAGYGRQFLKPVGLNETRQILMEKYAGVPIRKTYTCSAAQFGYIDRPRNKLNVPMHYVLTNDKAHQLGRTPLPFGKVRIFQDDSRGTVAFLGEDWGKFTPLDDEMRLYLGKSRDIVVIRTIERKENRRIAGNLYDCDIVVKYEIENFKNQPVTLDISENLRQLRDELLGNRPRDVQWELGKQTSFVAGPDKEESTFEKLLFHADLPAKPADGKAKKIVHRLHVVIKNHW